MTDQLSSEIVRFLVLISLLMTLLGACTAPPPKPSEAEEAATALVEDDPDAPAGDPPTANEEDVLPTALPAEPTETVVPPTATAQPTPEPEPTLKPTEIPFEENYVQALEAAQGQFPEYSAAFGELKNSEYPLFVYLEEDNGNYKRHHLVDSNISFEMRDNELHATFQFENQPAVIDMRWFPVEKAGVEIPGYWAVKQFSTSVGEFYIGFDSYNRQDYIKGERFGITGGGLNLSDILTVELGAGVEPGLDINSRPYLGSSREELLVNGPLRGIYVSEDAPIIEPPFDNIDVEAAFNKPALHTFANLFFNTNDATSEQIAAVSACRNNAVTPEQQALIEKTENFQRHGKLAASYNSPIDGAGVWDFSSGSPISYVLKALPLPGEQTDLPIVEQPLQGPSNKISFDENGHAVVRIMHTGNWSSIVASHNFLAYYLGLPPETNPVALPPPVVNDPYFYTFIWDSYWYAMLTNDEGKKVIVGLNMVQTKNRKDN